MAYSFAENGNYKSVRLGDPEGHKRKIVPDSPPPSAEDLNLLHQFVCNSQRLVVLTGAGISTESGIPDYRSPNGSFSRGFKPITHQEFTSSAKSQRRYWARSYVGWKRFIAAEPGPSHTTLAYLEARGYIKGMITQNVDRLHYRAGSNPLELHGTTHVVTCLDCSNLTSRHVFQERIRQLNPEWAISVESFEKGETGSCTSIGMQQQPDGDIEIDEKFWEQNFEIPACAQCGGILKPDVVLFGDSIPKSRADAAMSTVKEADALLVVGSSLMVFSAFRLAKAAHDNGSPVAILNIGPTRADCLASLKIQCHSGEILPRLLGTGSLYVPKFR